MAIQGAGHVGYYLTQELTQLGARVSVCDLIPSAAQRLADEFGAQIVTPESIYSIECDVFAPCALGPILNLKTIRELRATIVAGSTNNQLAHRHHGAVLFQHGILYAPDFVINSGGLIEVAALYDHANLKKASKLIEGTYDRLLEIFERAKAENRPTSQVAEMMVVKRLYES